jgi:LysR family transcriptional regulator of gallate degradation
MKWIITVITRGYEQMNARQMEYFIRAVELGSLGKAARSLNISQPALSKSLHQLEAEMQTRLVERTNYGVRATVFGECLYEHAKRAEGEFVRARHEIEALRGASRGSISIGVVPIVARQLLPIAVARLGRLRPGITVSVTERQNASIFASFYTGEFDFIVAAMEAPPLEANLTTKILFYDELVVAVRADHPLASLGSVTAEDLTKYPWIYPKMGTPFRRRVDDYFHAAKTQPPKCLVEGGSDNFVRALLAESDLVAIVAESLVEEERQGGRIKIIRLGSRRLRRPIGIIHRGWSKLTPASRALISELEKANRQKSG